MPPLRPVAVIFFLSGEASPVSATSPDAIAEVIAAYLTENPTALLVEDGRVLFDFAVAHYSAAAERERCLLQVWSEERNVVRRVLSAERKADVLRLSVQRFGQARPSRVELCPAGERRAATALRAQRAVYQSHLERAAALAFPGFVLERLTTSADLAHSFGGVCARGLLRRGQQRVAIVGLGAGEPQSSIDNAVATAILWLDYCREHLCTRGRTSRGERSEGHVTTLALFVPEGRTHSARLRMGLLNREAAEWRLFALDETTGHATEIDLTGELNIDTRLVHNFDRRQTLERFAISIAHLRKLCPAVDAVAVAPAEVSFRYHGLEFARATMEPDAHFRLCERIVFGAPPAEYELNEQTEPALERLIRALEQKRGGRDRTHPLYRLQPERWLQSLVERDLSLLDARLDPTQVYAQVPAFAASDRAVLDLLGITHDGRLAVIELKAAEDVYLPMQGLDYWARVRHHLRRGELQKHGYFPGRELSTQDPILILAAPALHVHTSAAAMLRYVSPEVDWRLVGLDEHWRDGIRVVFHKESEKS
jgi:hypothetical protein